MYKCNLLELLVHYCHLKLRLLVRLIYIYSHFIGDDEKHFEFVILKIMRTLFKPHLKKTFDLLKNCKKNSKKNDTSEQRKIEPINEKDKKDSKLEEQNKKINKRYLEYSPTHNRKANSYLYESSSEESFESIRPNSLDNEKWHQFLMMIYCYQ